MIVPQLIDAVTWCNLTAQDLSVYGTLPVVRNLVEWRSWAKTAVQLDGIQALKPPLPDQYENWDEWASLFIEIFV